MAQEAHGYEISYDETKNILKFRAWGLWNMETARNFEQEWTDWLKQVSADGNPWYALIDLTAFPPQKQEVQEFTQRMIELEQRYGVQKEAHLVNQVLTKWQIARIAREANLAENSFFQSEAEAVQWLLADSA